MTATLPERSTLAPPVPALEPDDNKRASVKAWRREVADWLRAHGITATGEAWESATFGERDPAVLRRIAADAGALVPHWSGHILPAALADGDMTDWGQVIGAPITDPETGGVWVTVRRVTGATDHEVATLSATVTDHELPAGVPVTVTRGKGRR